MVASERHVQVRTVVFVPNICANFLLWGIHVKNQLLEWAENQKVNVGVAKCHWDPPRWFAYTLGIWQLDRCQVP